MKTIIHVNQHVIKANRKTGANDPPLTIKTYKQTRQAHSVVLLDKCQVIYRPHNPLSCGAHVWIETMGDVKIDYEDTDINTRNIFSKRVLNAARRKLKGV